MSGVATVESWSGKDRGDENFPVGSLLIRRDLRAHVHAFYAFARNADDIADSSVLSPQDKIGRLDAMEHVLLGRSDTGSPSALRLRSSLTETGVTSRHSTDLLIAFRRDATQNRYADWDDLLDYCRCSAMPVGRHVLDLHGEDRATYAPSDALCTSLQVLNHLQDCVKDLAQLDRCYLPQDLLAEFGASAGDLQGVAATPGLRRVFDALLQRVDTLNAAAADLPRLTRSRRLRLETAVIVGLAQRLAQRLRHADPVARRVRLTKADAAGSMLAALRYVRRPDGSPLNADRADLDAIEAIVRSAGTSFYRGMRVLPPDRRHAMYAIYAYPRMVDDIADEDGAFADKQPRLAAWRDRVAGLYLGRTDGPVTRVLLAAVQRFDLRQEDFLAVIDGMEMDAETAMVAPDLPTLDLYCDRVAAAVGRLSVRAFGDASAPADRVAYSLGRALQLTNILRDLAEDADRGRLYLPREWLDEAGVPHEPGAALTAAGLPRVCQRVAALAHEHFRAAHTAMRQCDAKAMKPARLMGATYAAILSRLEQRGWSQPGARVSLPAWQKLWLLLRYGLG